MELIWQLLQTRLYQLLETLTLLSTMPELSVTIYEKIKSVINDCLQDLKE